MTWAQEFARKLREEEQAKIAKVKAAGFRVTKVTEEEFEDGVGACVGWNAVKGHTFYTLNQALKETGA